MANTSISDVTNQMKLGENKTINAELDAASNPGDAMYWSEAGKVKPLETDSDDNFAGINGGRYDVDIDTQVSSGEKIELIIEGYTAAKIADPGATIHPNTPLYAGQTNNSSGGELGDSVPNSGSTDFEPLDVSRPVALTTKQADNGDTVALIKILR